MANRRAAAVAVIIVVVALCGYPRYSGRCIHAIAAVLLALLSLTIHNYIRPGGSYDPRESAFPYSFLYVGVFIAAGAAIGCLLGTLVYRKPSDRAIPPRVSE
jgi:hypothetical protein